MTGRGSSKQSIPKVAIASFSEKNGQNEHQINEKHEFLGKFNRFGRVFGSNYLELWNRIILISAERQLERPFSPQIYINRLASRLSGEVSHGKSKLGA